MDFDFSRFDFAVGVQNEGEQESREFVLVESNAALQDCGLYVCEAPNSTRLHLFDYHEYDNGTALFYERYTREPYKPGELTIIGRAAVEMKFLPGYNPTDYLTESLG